MSIIGIGLNLLLAGLLVAALAVGLRLNRRLRVLRDSQDGFASAVQALNIAAARAEQGLADLRAAMDEANDTLGDRIEKGRALANRLERMLEQAPARAAAPSRAESHPESEAETVERRFGALLAAAREARVRPEPPRRGPPARPAASFDDELFEDRPLSLSPAARR